jgi:hypothetical protein
MYGMMGGGFPGQMMGYTAAVKGQPSQGQPGPQAVLRVKVVKAATVLAADGPSPAATNVRPIPPQQGGRGWGGR